MPPRQSRQVRRWLCPKHSRRRTPTAAAIPATARPSPFASPSRALRSAVDRRGPRANAQRRTAGGAWEALAGCTTGVPPLCAQGLAPAELKDLWWKPLSFTATPDVIPAYVVVRHNHRGQLCTSCQRGADTHRRRYRSRPIPGHCTIIHTHSANPPAPPHAEVPVRGEASHGHLPLV